MMNLGSRPTFDDPRFAIEAHLFDADADLYGARVRLEFIHRMRETRRFETPDALRAQLQRDEVDARAILKSAT
jgi:riboflavin kinase/FMN adenylyltransferase